MPLWIFLLTALLYNVNELGRYKNHRSTISLLLYWTNILEWTIHNLCNDSVFCATIGVQIIQKHDFVYIMKILIAFLHALIFIFIPFLIIFLSYSFLSFFNSYALQIQNLLFREKYSNFMNCFFRSCQLSYLSNV